jgi:hypothetical protein
VAWMESWNKALPSHKRAADHAIELRVGVDAHCDTSKLQVSRPSEQSLSDIKSKNSRCLRSKAFLSLKEFEVAAEHLRLLTSPVLKLSRDKRDATIRR